jgi:hypothetical protein
MQDLIAMGYKENSRKFKRVFRLAPGCIECGKPRFAQACCKHHESSPVPGEPGFTECFERFELDLMGTRGRFARVLFDIEAELRLHSASCSVLIDPSVIDPAGAGISQELFERLGHRLKSLAMDRLIDAIVPFDAGLQGHAGDVRATDIGSVGVASGSVVRVVKEVGFRVERDTFGALDNVEFEVWAQFEQILEGFGLGHIKVIARDDSNSACAQEEVLQVPSQQIDAALLDKRHREVHLGRSIQRRFQVG